MPKYKTIEEYYEDMKKKNKEWYKKNSEAKKQYQREYYKKNREQILNKMKNKRDKC